MTPREMVRCANPSCKRMIELIIRSGNSDERNKYCSSNCWSAFSPAMIRVCEENKKPILKSSLKDLIVGMRKEDGMTKSEIAAVLGITTKTLRVWCKKVGVRTL